MRKSAHPALHSPPPSTRAAHLAPPSPQMSPLCSHPEEGQAAARTTREVTNPRGFWEREGPHHIPYILIRVAQVKLPFL